MGPDTINWIAVIGGAVAAFLLGWALYSPALFGKGWAEGSRVEMGSAAQMPVLAMAMQMVALLLLSLTIGLALVAGLMGLAVTAILAAAAFSVSGGKFSQKSNYAVAVDGGYIVAAGVLMLVVHSLL